MKYYIGLNYKWLLLYTDHLLTAIFESDLLPMR